MRVIIALLAIFLATSAGAEMCENYATLAARSNAIEKAMHALERAIRPIETVPASDAEYIDREVGEALQQGNRARFDLVITHRFYYAHKVRKQYAQVSRNLEAARDTKRITDQVIYLSDALSEYADMRSYLRDYDEFDVHRRQPILSAEARQDIRIELTVVQRIILQTIKCGVRQMREPD